MINTLTAAQGLYVAPSRPQNFLFHNTVYLCCSKVFSLYSPHLNCSKKGNKCGYETTVAVNVLIDDGLSYIPNYTATFSTFTFRQLSFRGPEIDILKIP